MPGWFVRKKALPVLVIICTTATILLAGALLSVAWARFEVTQWQGDNLVQLGIAEAGIEHAHRLLLNDSALPPLPILPSSVTWRKATTP